jgi:rubrerythrin
MKYRVRHTPQANREIAVIAKALAPYPNMGRRIFQEMDRKLNGLKDNPFAWPAYHANPKYRRINEVEDVVDMDIQKLECENCGYVIDNDGAVISDDDKCPNCGEYELRYWTDADYEQLATEV